MPYFCPVSLAQIVDGRTGSQNECCLMNILGEIFSSNQLHTVLCAQAFRVADLLGEIFDEPPFEIERMTIFLESGHEPSAREYQVLHPFFFGRNVLTERFKPFSSTCGQEVRGMMSFLANQSHADLSGGADLQIFRRVAILSRIRKSSPAR